MGATTWSDEKSRRFAQEARKLKSIDYLPWAKRISSIIYDKFTSPVIADVGCGPGLLSLELARLLPDSRFILTDSAGEMVAMVQEETTGQNGRFEIIQSPAEALKLGDARVDVAICKHLLVHVDDPGRVLSEIARVLKPGGIALVIDFDPESSRLLAGLLRLVIRLRMGSYRSEKFWNAYQNGYPSSRLQNGLSQTGLVPQAAKRQGVNYLVQAEKPPVDAFQPG
jgi:ubiquinone/menaquinone biosynthesis C-methylase UbiE